MKKALIALLLLTLAFAALPAAAETATQDGVRATLTTDKDTYSVFDLVEAKLTVENVSNQPISNVSAYIEVPKGYVLEAGSQEKAEAASLASGQTLTCTALLRNSQTFATLPSTGDDSGIGFTILLMLAALGTILAGILRGGGVKAIPLSAA